MTRARTTTTRLRRVIEAVLEEHADSSSSSTTDDSDQLTHLVQSLLLYGRVFRACQAVLHEGTSSAQCTTALHDALRAALHKHTCIDMAATLCHTLLPLFGLPTAESSTTTEETKDSISNGNNDDDGGLVRVCEVVVSLARHLIYSKDHASYERECARLPAIRQVVTLHDPASQTDQNVTTTSTMNTESALQPQSTRENTPRAEKRGRAASQERRRATTTTTTTAATQRQASQRARAHAAIKYEPITMDTLYGDLVRTTSLSPSSSSSSSPSPSGSAPREEGAPHDARTEEDNNNKEELVRTRDSDVIQQQQQQAEMQHYVEWMRADCTGELLSTQTYTRFTDLLASTGTRDGNAQRSNIQTNNNNKKLQPPGSSSTEKTSSRKSTPDIARLPSTTREALDEVSEVLAAVSRVLCGRTTVDENAWDYGRNRITVAQSSTIYLTQQKGEEEEKKKGKNVERGKEGEGSAKADEHEGAKGKERDDEEEEGVPLALFAHETGLLYTAAGDVFAMEVTTPERW